MKLRLSANFLLSLVLAFIVTSSARHTGKLSAEQKARFAKEGVAHRADDLTFRRTTPAGQRDSGWTDQRASVVVTRESVFLHVNEKPLVEITPRSTGFYEVHRDRDRISLRAGSGKSAAIWSFHPPDNADAWAVDIRSVIRKAKNR